MPKRYYQLSATGTLHKMEAGHAGEDASNPMDASLISLDRYDLCGHCFGSKATVGGALNEQPAADAEEGVRKPRRRGRALAHGVQSAE